MTDDEMKDALTALLAFEFESESDEDDDVREMENLAYALQHLSQASQSRFVALAQKAAEIEGDPNRAAFLRDIREHLGLS